MTNQTVKIYFLCLSIIFIAACDNNAANVDLYPKFNFPVLSGGASILTSYQDDILSEQTEYSIDHTVDPSEIFRFYETFLAGMKFSKNTSEVFPNQPVDEESFMIDGHWQQPPARYIAGWVNEEKSMVAKISVFYKKNMPARVVCFLHPNSNQTPLLKFTTKLQKNGQFNEFLGILGKYQKDNGNFDIEKAKANERPTELFTEMVYILDKDIKQLHDNYLKYNN